jgi:CDP-glucose 4,6-dehydratase
VEDLERLKRMPNHDLVDAFRGKRVLVTGHTGFKGGWLVAWLHVLGAEVTGFARAPDTEPSLYEALGVASMCRSEIGDIRDHDHLAALLARVRPEFLFHLAAQPLVRRGYKEPLETFDVNVRGTATVLEALRLSGRPCQVVVVSSDKCYQNEEWVHGYREDDKLGGHDPYSASKAATEIVAASYRQSFFATADLARHGVALATARAGNVIGGGDWSEDRIVPDAVAALRQGRPIVVRNPGAVRPWQHVLEPLSGYLALAAALSRGTVAERADFCGPYNFGPLPVSQRTVADLVKRVVAAWGSGSWVDGREPNAPREAGVLALSIDKAVAHLDWRPRWSFADAVARTMEWYRTFYARQSESPPEAVRACTKEQIRAYMEAGGADA